jgi:hypothetical protein
MATLPSLLRVEPSGACLNLSWITPGLALGGRFELDACEHLVKALGIRHVVDVRIETCDDEEGLRRHGIELLHLPTADGCAVSQEMLDEGVAWVSQRLDEGHKVYVHCEHGAGRSALVGLCVLVSRGLSPIDALRTAKQARWQVSPSREQLEAFRTWCRRHGVPSGRIPTFDELAQLAYADLRGGSLAGG